MEIQSNAVNGLNSAHNEVNKHASNLASKEAMEGKINIPKELTEMTESEQNFSANSKVIKAENEMTGSILDVKV